MKYFRLALRDAAAAQCTVWRIQRENDRELTKFHTHAVGLECSVWTEDSEAEASFRQALDAANAIYKEDDEQQIIAKGFGIPSPGRKEE